MDTNIIKCPNCGAACKAKDEYCKSCWKKLSVEIQPDESITAGMRQSEWVDWQMFIGKNADRYIEIYKKNHQKKIFPHMNWSAFFFGLSWVLYRRMTKAAIVGFLITSLLLLSLFSVFLLPYRAEIKDLREDIEPYQEYIDSGRETILFDAQGVPYSPEIVMRGGDASRKLAEIESKAQLKCYLIIIPFTCAFWGFFGDAIYKMHIKEKIRSNNGGTSVAELLGGRILFSVIELLLLNPLTSLITEILY